MGYERILTNGGRCMAHETLPDWLWLLFYSFIGLTLLATIINLLKKVHIKATIINLALLSQLL